MDPTNPTQTEGEVPQPVVAEPSQSSTSIPKERLDQEIAKRKSAEAAAAAAQKELEALRSKATPPKPDASQTAPESGDLRAEVQFLKEQHQRRELQGELRLQDVKQAEAVQTILKANPDLKASEALSIAQARQPDLFGGEDKRAFNPGQHGVLRPSGGGPQPVVKSLKERSVEVAGIKDPILRDREEKRLFGKELAKVLGWQRPD